MRLAIVLALFLSACAGPTAIRGTGERVAPPLGFVDWCWRHKTDPACVPMFEEIERENAATAADKKGR